MSEEQNPFQYEHLIVDIPDFPKEGIVFKDVMPVLKDPDGFRTAVDDIAEHFTGKGITKVMGSEARGFLFGAPVAYAMGVGFIPARKPGKLPREVISEEYALEYGTDELQIHADSLTEEDVVLIVDDLMATGGTAVAQAKLVEKSGAKVAGFGFFMELDFLEGRAGIADALGTEYEIHSTVHVS